MAGSGTSATSADIKALKTRLNTELQRRSGHGALQGWSKDFTASANQGQTIVKSQLAETMGYASGNPNATYDNGKLVKYEEINTSITNLEAGTSTTTGCSGLCTGFCTTTCANSNTGHTVCSDACTSTCSTGCTTACANGCTDGCTTTCGSGCINTCTGTCAKGSSSTG